MTDLVFVTESSLFDRDVKGSISRTFFAKFVSNQAIEQVDSETIIWVIVKRNSDYYLQSRLKVNLVQRYIQGRLSGWYVIDCAKNYGGHIYPPSDLGAVIDISSEFEMFPECDTVDLVSHSSISLLNKIYSTTLRKTNLRLNKDNRRKFLINYVNKNIDDLSFLVVSQIELELREHFYESELLLLASIPNNYDPYLSSAFEIFSIINNVPLESIPSYLDQFGHRSKIKSLRKYYTDCRLRSFTEDDFSAREMIWNPDSFGEDKNKASLLKSNLAEQRHQEMLRQLTMQFNSMGVVPLRSSSIDLAIEFDDAIAIFEIKSSTVDNYKDQAFKGCSQLSEYAYNLSQITIKKIFKILILETPTDGEVDIEYVSMICKNMSVTTLNFNFVKEWPDRCVLPNRSMMV